MKRNAVKITLSAFLFLAVWASASAQNTPPAWSAVDALGRKIEPSAPRKGKFAGVFYFVWQGGHGYDNYVFRPSGDIKPPTPEDVNSPYDIQKIIDANPENPQYGPMHAFHHWGEPYLGYYVANDEWVIRKHAQMLSDAGIDVIIFDVTNRHPYLKTVEKICEVYAKMRADGNKTPQIAFLLNTAPQETLRDIYDNFYAKNKYPELWFQWLGKPLVFAPPEAFDDETREFFTARHSWFSSKREWFGDGKDKCTWADYYPQGYGWHESPDKPEMMSVSPATHPIDNKIDLFRVGRSFHDGRQPGPGEQQPELGLYFDEQLSRAMEVDPEFIFFSGWNEWVAMRWDNGNDTIMGDYVLKPNSGVFFVDVFNHEYSRDIEPLRGHFGDNYYYQMAGFLRKFKGSEPAQKFSGYERPALADLNSFNNVKASYKDDKGDTFHRSHYGFGYKLGTLTNDTGRNDIVECKVANDGENLFFYAECADNITPRTDPKWMRLFIKINGNDGANWEGFQFLANAAPQSDAKTTLAKSKGGWDWEKVGDIEYRADGNKIALKIPLSMLGVKTPDGISLDFKWVDNAIENGDIQECLTDGDSAPNGRFRYRYEFAK